MKEQKIELGDKVKCKYSGFVGFAVAKTEFINGCIQFEVVPKVNKNNEMREPLNIDENSLIIVRKAKKEKKEKKVKKKKDNGGATRKATDFRGF
jgi:hypothetical protein